MCIAIYNSAKGLDLTEQEMWNCWVSNPDGMGMMWAHEGELQTFKLMDDVDEFYDKYLQVRDLDTNIMIHFRVGTQGLVNLDNCHPFLVHENLGFMHNGILPGTEYDPQFKGDQRSDTLVYVDKVLRKLPRTWLGNHVIRNLIEAQIGTFNKFVFMTRSGQVHILNEQQGTWEYGNWFSNYSHKSWTTYGNTTKNTNKRYWDEDDWDSEGYDFAYGSKGRDEEGEELGFVYNDQYYCWDCLPSGSTPNNTRYMVKGFSAFCDDCTCSITGDSNGSGLTLLKQSEKEEQLLLNMPEQVEETKPIFLTNYSPDADGEMRRVEI